MIVFFFDDDEEKFTTTNPSNLIVSHFNHPQKRYFPYAKVLFPLTPIIFLLDKIPDIHTTMPSFTWKQYMY